MLLIICPNCGERNITEFRFGGEIKRHPDHSEDQASDQALMANLYLKENRLGVQQEWWYHRAGCGLWFIAERHTKSHVIEQTYFWEPNP
jgi:sarcosine oxidase subunit delta